MAFSIREEPGRYAIRFYGSVVAADLREAAVAMWELEKGRPVTLPRVTDLSEAEDMNIDFQAVLQLADDRRGRTFPNSFKSAIVAPRPHQLGFARMFQTLNDHPQITVRVFNDMPLADKWLREAE